MNTYLSNQVLHDIASKNTTPLFVYSHDYLRNRAAELIGLDLPYGHTVRYAVKANPHPEVISIFDAGGLHFDASSSYEVELLLRQGIAAQKISLSSQQPAHNMDILVAEGVHYVATSLQQLRLYIAAAGPGSKVGLRINPGLGAGHNNRTTTGGANSSFGLWISYLEDALALASQAEITIDRLHVHIGSGADPKMWGAVVVQALHIVAMMPDVTTLDIGGGFKVHRYGDEQEADMHEIAQVFSHELTAFANRTGRQIKLEIEPGTWLVAHAGVLVSEIVDIVDTGKDGHTFLRLNTGMNDIIRPSMYGAQHNITILTDTAEEHEYVVVGHNCETSDIITPAPSDPEGLQPRLLPKVEIGDLLVIHDTGAYCASFAVHQYNAFPSAEEILY